MDSPKQRRRLSGLIVNKAAQFKLAVLCSSILLLPSLIVSISLLSALVMEAAEMAGTGAAAADIVNFLIERGYTYAWIILGGFLFFSAISAFLSLRLSNQMIGPVARLENQVEEMLKGNYEPRAPLRKNDYLENLGQLLNQLAAKRSKS